MQNYHLGDVVLLAFPFAEQQKVKRRPALVLLDAGDADILVARITSHDVDTDYDVRVVEWKRAGLLLPSVIRLHKLATLQKTLVKNKLGTLSSNDLAKTRIKLQQICGTIGKVNPLVSTKR